MHASHTCSQNLQTPSSGKRGRQELIVQINIGRKGEPSQIRLSDINNMNYIEYQIKTFIKAHGLKDTAFSFIKELISKQIGQRREQIYQQSHSKCNKHCKCQNKMRTFQEKEKMVLGAISLNHSKKSQGRSAQKGQQKEGQHIMIKITQKERNAEKNENSPTFANSNAYTLSSSTAGRERNHCYTEVFNSSSPFEQANTPVARQSRMATSNFFAVKQETETSLPKTSNVSNIFQFFQSKKSMKDSVLSQRKVKILSTRQRKQAIMTPKKERAESKPAIALNGSHLQSMVSLYKDNLKQTNSKIIQKLLAEPLFPDKCISPAFEAVIESLFQKLTMKNPPGLNQLHSQYISYQQLQRDQLQFMGALFQKIDHKELNHLNYGNFRTNALKYCWKELEILAQVQQ